MYKKPEPITRRILESVDSSGVRTRYTLSPRGTISSELFYPKSWKSLQEELDQSNKKLPKTRQRFMTDEGKIVSYYRAKQLGLTK